MYWINILIEDPTLSFEINKESGQIMLTGMGELHLDIIIDRISREYNLLLKTNKLQIAYKEMLLNRCVEECVHKTNDGLTNS